MLDLLLLLVMQVEFGSSPGPVEKVGSALLLFLCLFSCHSNSACQAGMVCCHSNTWVNDGSADQLATSTNCLAISFFKIKIIILGGGGDELSFLSCSLFR